MLDEAIKKYTNKEILDKLVIIEYVLQGCTGVYSMPSEGMQYVAQKYASSLRNYFICNCNPTHSIEMKCLAAIAKNKKEADRVLEDIKGIRDRLFIEAKTYEKED